MNKPPQNKFTNKYVTLNSQSHASFCSKYKPTTSYGIILYTTTQNNDILFLSCQRRDSISYSEFLKDNVDENDIEKYVNLMSQEEIKRCLDYYNNDKVEMLWDDLWVSHFAKSYKQDRDRCCEAFRRNMKRYYDIFLNAKGRSQNEWGFPKGRKHKYETDLSCALREFEEESKIPKEMIHVNTRIRPYHENYIGTDNKRYRTIYYTSYIEYEKIPFTQTIDSKYVQRSYVSEEISQLRWMSFPEILEKISEEKQKIIKSINKLLLYNLPLSAKIERRHSF